MFFCEYCEILKNSFFYRTPLWGPLSMIFVSAKWNFSDYISIDICWMVQWQFPFGQLLLRTIAPHEISTRTTSPRTLPASPSDNCSWIISPWTTLPWTITPLWNHSRTITSQNFETITPEWFPLGNCPPDNYLHEIPVYINNRNTKEWVKLMIYGNITN